MEHKPKRNIRTLARLDELEVSRAAQWRRIDELASEVERLQGLTDKLFIGIIMITVATPVTLLFMP